MEDGDISTARNLYKESVDVKETSEGWHNLAVGVFLSFCYLMSDLGGQNCEYHLRKLTQTVLKGKVEVDR